MGVPALGGWWRPWKPWPWMANCWAAVPGLGWELPGSGSGLKMDLARLGRPPKAGYPHPARRAGFSFRGLCRVGALWTINPKTKMRGFPWGKPSSAIVIRR